jgi:hypothetical protein
VIIDPRFLDLVTSWRWVVSFTPWPVYPRVKSPWNPLDRGLGGPQSRFGQIGEQKIRYPAGARTPAPPRCSQSLYRLRHPDSVLVVAALILLYLANFMTLVVTWTPQSRWLDHSEYSARKYVEWSGHGIILWYCPEGLRKITINLGQDSQFSDRDSNWALPPPPNIDQRHYRLSQFAPCLSWTEGLQFK